MKLQSLSTLTLASLLVSTTSMSVPTIAQASLIPNSWELTQMRRINARQGVRGKVMRLVGDYMPTVGVHPNRQPPQPVATTVWIFSGRIQSNANQFWSLHQARQHPQFLRKVRSDAQGRFEANLKPGEYTLLAQYGDQLYLNSFEGDGSYSTIKVTRGQWTEIDLVNTEQATF